MIRRVCAAFLLTPSILLWSHSLPAIAQSWPATRSRPALLRSLWAGATGGTLRLLQAGGGWSDPPGAPFTVGEQSNKGGAIVAAGPDTLFAAPGNSTFF